MQITPISRIEPLQYARREIHERIIRKGISKDAYIEFCLYCIQLELDQAEEGGSKSFTTIELIKADPEVRAAVLQDLRRRGLYIKPVRSRGINKHEISFIPFRSPWDRFLDWLDK